MHSGILLNDRYRLESLLGRGGMGSVWRAEHLGLRAPVAVKLMDPALGMAPEALARFQREAQAAATIRSPHVVQVLDHGLDQRGQIPFIVMELLEGETLGARLAREGKLSLAKTAAVVADVCHALMRAHPAGIVHRDLKPDNIFLVQDEREFAKVLDFGVARSRPHASDIAQSTTTGSLIGTPRYMSPEQISGSKELDGRSDLWSVALIACECITGKCLFDEDTFGSLVLAICTRPVPSASSLGPVTPELDAWLARALERNPARRFQTARELSESLTSICLQPGQLTSRSLDSEREARPFSRVIRERTEVLAGRRSRAGGAAVSGALLLLGVAAWLAFGSRMSEVEQASVRSAFPGNSGPAPGLAAASVPPAPAASQPVPISVSPLVATVEAAPLPAVAREPGQEQAHSIPGAPGPVTAGDATPDATPKRRADRRRLRPPRPPSLEGALEGDRGRERR